MNDCQSTVGLMAKFAAQNSVRGKQRYYNSAGEESYKKMPRLSDLTRDGLRDDLKSDRDVFKANLQASLMEGFRAKLADASKTLSTTLRSGFVVELQIQKAIMDALEADSSESSSLAHDAQKWLASIQADLTTISAKVDGLSKEITSLKAKRPVVGEEGFLGQCQAPEEWEQRSYEARLLRADLYCIGWLGVPDESAEGGEEALRVVMDKFPDIPESYLEVALKHTHVQVYGLPLSSRLPRNPESPGVRELASILTPGLSFSTRPGLGILNSVQPACVLTMIRFLAVLGSSTAGQYAT